MAVFEASIPTLGVNTPTQVASQLAQLNQQQAEAQYDQQAVPLKIGQLKSQLQQMDLSNTKSALDLQVQQAMQKNRITSAQQEMMANEFSTFDPDAPDPSGRWDEMIDQLVENGAPQAAQYKGRYSPQLAERWAKAYAAQSPSAALAAVNNGGNAPEGGGAGVNGNFAGVTNGAEATQFDKLFAGQTPQQMQGALQNASAHMAAVRRIEQSSDPLKTLQDEALNLGYSQLQVASVQGSDVPNLLAKVKATYGPVENYLTARLGRTGAGIPNPQIPAELKDVGGTLQAIDTTNPAKPVATEIASGAGKYQPYTDAQGNAWSYNAKTGQFEEAPNGPKGLMKPTGAGGRTSVYEQKRQAYLALHPTDAQGALDYASGRKSMSQADIVKAADAQATRDYQAISLTGPPTDPATGKPVDPQTWINNRAREITGDLTAANNQSAAAPAAAAPSGGGKYTPAQSAVLARYKGSTSPAGSIGSPYVVTTRAQLDKLPDGAYFIDTDGTVRHKIKQGR